MNKTAVVKGTADGRSILEYTLTRGPVKATIINVGACITSLIVPDRNGHPDDVVLGYEDYTMYLTNPCFFGCVIGRVANRIGGGRFTLNGKEYTFEKNERGWNMLHCADHGYQRRFWDVDEENSSETCLILTLDSPDGDGGFPGHVQVKTVYTLTEDQGLSIEYFGTTDADTYINLTNHSFFNLDGHDSGDILDHTMWINAETFTPFSPTLVPTGERVPVEGTPIDFRKPRILRPNVDSEWEQIQLGGGYDNNFILEHEGLAKVAEVVGPRTGRRMEVLTTCPAMQFYSGNGVPDGRIRGKGGVLYVRRGGLCLEPHYIPNTPNLEGAEKFVLHPGETYYQKSVYRFS